MDHAEHSVGYPLPELLRRIYTEVGDGGFGPDGGLASLTPRRVPHWHPADWPCATTLHAKQTEWGAPVSWFFLTSGGCTMEWYVSLIAKLIATRALRYGPYAIVAGDINYPPADPTSPSPDYAAMLPYNKSARTRLPSETGGQLVPDRRVTEILAYTGFVDAAAKLFEERGDKELLRRTATDDRIDQLWVSGPLRDTITDYALLDTPADASDHHGLVVRIDLDRARTDNMWEYK
ncbi:hypothetical protein ACFQ6O_46205 [Streptomyces sp. NPDC056441]|uniref:hypothetical protein n=1 Tax=Streptomyces sp. NPDC056441 TaxID=3345817 RepID=UPI0036B48958